MSEWYYMSGGQQQGPIPGGQLKSLAASGGLLPEDLVWNESMTEWLPAKRVKGLSFAGQSAAPKAAPKAAARAAAPAATPAAAQSFDAAPQQFQHAPAPAETEYSQPAETLAYAGSDGQPVTAGTVEILRQTMMWVRIVAILLFVYTGLLLLIGLGGLVMAFVGASSRRGATLVGMGVGLFFGYAIIAAIVFFPGFFLMRYAGGIKKLQETGRSTELETALGAQRLYFLFIGIVGLVFASLGVILVIVRFLGAMF